MARIAGIKTTKDAKGNLASITINTKKHPQAVEVLQKIGLVAKSDIEKELEGKKWVTLNELEETLQATVKEHYAGSNR